MSSSINFPIVLFDGVCNFCNSWVNFIIRHDKKGKIKFSALQSESGKKILEANNLSHLINNLDTFVFIEPVGNSSNGFDDGKIYVRSSAGVHLAKYLDGGWKLFSLFIIIPTFIRDAVYNFIAKNRYKWWGKRNECMIPTKEIQGRFL